MCGEWKARSTGNCFTLRPRSDHSPAMRSTVSRSPERTTEFGAFTAEIPARCSDPASDSRASASETRIATMTPPTGVFSRNSRIRSASSAQTSGRENTPATVAAASSPTECPTT